MAPEIPKAYNLRAIQQEADMIGFFKEVWNDGWAGKVLMIITPIVLWAIVNLDYLRIEP